jgi:hypothetical protein
VFRRILHGLPANADRYTAVVKTAVSIPDQIFEKAERLAKRTSKSRSQLFSDAIEEYVGRHAPDDVTEAFDKVCADLNGAADEFGTIAAQRILQQTEW